jgi:hypothetical protein
MSTLNHSILPPSPSRVLYALFVALVATTISLFWSALSAFGLVMEPGHAFFAAAAIELSGVVEALALVRAKTWRATALPLSGVLITLIVSGTYNYVQVAQAGAKSDITHPWVLTCFALGPLFALTFLALTTGRLLHEHETAVAEWYIARQKRQDEQAAAEATREAEAQRIAQQQAALDAQHAAEAQARREEFAHQERLEAARVEAAAQARRDQLAYQAELKRIQTSRKAVPERSTSPQAAPESSPEHSAPSAAPSAVPAAKISPAPETFQHLADLRGTFPTDWRKLSADQKHSLDAFSAAEIAYVTGLTDRAGRDWKKRLAANGFHANIAPPQESLL